MKIKLTENKIWKMLRSPISNFNFNKETGFMMRWGKTHKEDAVYSPFPEILDIEITEICNGPNGRICPACYKSNQANKGRNMSFGTFKNIIDKMPFLTQTALGADAEGITNPDMFKMMQYARSKNIIPNLTIASVSEEVAKKLAAVAGAVAVSVYKHAGFDIAFDSVKRLYDAGQKNINLHYMISKKTISDAYSVVDSLKTDSRLKSVSSIVFLSLKQKGRGEKFDTVTEAEYKDLVMYCLNAGISFGFDSCSAPVFLESVKDHPNYTNFKQRSEDCESLLFSSYISVTGELYPCSFTENWKEGGWETGIDVTKADDFIKDVWFDPRVKEFRQTLIKNTDTLGCRNCPAFVICSRDYRIHKNDENLIPVLNVS
jgi:radical SAM protein with 4Fe4S-binding SPASM domain